MQFIDLAAQRARIEDSVNQAVLDVIASGKFILGPQVAELEQQLAQYIGVKHAIGCANGTDALLLPLMAKGIGAGDAVFCPSFTFAATAEVVALTGATPVFIDVDAQTYNINVEQLAEAIAWVKKEGKLQAKAIIPVDLFGLPADYSAIKKLAEAHGLFIIEDAAQSIGGKYQGTMCGAFGDVGATSFYPAKPLGCYGDGGAMFTNDDEMAEKLRSLLFHGKGVSQYDNIYIGLNSRLDTIQAAILLEKMKIFEDEVEKRAVIGERYSRALKSVAQVVTLDNQTRSAYAQYTISVKNRDGLKQYLQDKSIPSMIYYVKPLHQQKAYENFPLAPGGLPVSERIANEVISLPMHPYLSQTDQDKVIEAVLDFYA